MKFKITVRGKDSISEGVSKATVAALKEKGIEPDNIDRDAWDDKFEKQSAKLEKFVKKFLIDGEGGDDSVVVEFDTDAKTCVVVPLKGRRSHKTVEENLAILRQCLRRLDCEMPLSDEEAGEQFHLAYAACDAIQKATN